MLVRTSAIKILNQRSICSLVKSTPKFAYSQKDQRFLRFLDLDAKYLSQIPYIFTPLKPIINSLKETIIQINQVVGLPWWSVLLLASITSRLSIFPLIFIQMKKASRIGPVWPIFAHLKQAWKDSNLPFTQRVKVCWNMYRKLAKQQNFRLRTVFVYNLAYYPILITMIFSLRSLLSVEAVAQSGFLYLNSLAEIDPYYILPTLTVAAYYWNFQRFITPENKHTIISRIRSLCQVLLIIWYPFLCCWPSGIVIYMLCNALISIGQANLMKSRWFQQKLNPKVMHYNYMLSTVEYDKSTSESIIQAIKTGEESLKQKSIKQEIIVFQTEQMVKKLNKQLQQEQKQQKIQLNEQKIQQKSQQLNSTKIQTPKIEVNEQKPKLPQEKGKQQKKQVRKQSKGKKGKNKK